MNPSRITSMGDYVIDRDAEQFNRDEAQQERRNDYVNKRSATVYERRVSNISRPDFILALEILNGQPLSIDRLMEMVFCHEDPTAKELLVMVKAALLRDSIDVANAEFRSMEAEPPCIERH